MKSIQESLTRLKGLYQREEMEKSSSGYQVLECIGKGNFGQVRRAIHIDTQVPVAIKILNKEKVFQNQDCERVKREIEILARVDHPNISYLYEVGKPNEIVDEHDYFFIVLEFCPKGTLSKYLETEKKFNESQACKFFWQILSAIEHMHLCGIVHRDVKPDNILLDEDGNLKIIDFGLGNLYSKSTRLKTPCGSPCYAPPEVDYGLTKMINGLDYDPEKTDLWSAGVTLFHMLTGRLPFIDRNIKNLYKRILDGSVDYPSSLSREATSLLQGILKTNPKSRMSFKEVFGHPWMQKYRPPGYPITLTRERVVWCD
jgi:5'-AMP-activated protein kinase catalytic alpha subunit